MPLAPPPGGVGLATGGPKYTVFVPTAAPVAGADTDTDAADGGEHNAVNEGGELAPTSEPPVVETVGDNVAAGDAAGERQHSTANEHDLPPPPPL